MFDPAYIERFHDPACCNPRAAVQMSSAATDPNATDEDKEIEQWKIRKLIKSLEAARG